MTRPPLQRIDDITDTLFQHGEVRVTNFIKDLAWYWKSVGTIPAVYHVDRHHPPNLRARFWRWVFGD